MPRQSKAPGLHSYMKNDDGVRAHFSALRGLMPHNMGDLGFGLMPSATHQVNGCCKVEAPSVSFSAKLKIYVFCDIKNKAPKRYKSSLEVN